METLFALILPVSTSLLLISAAGTICYLIVFCYGRKPKEGCLAQLLSINRLLGFLSLITQLCVAGSALIIMKHPLGQWWAKGLSIALASVLIWLLTLQQRQTAMIRLSLARDTLSAACYGVYSHQKHLAHLTTLLVIMAELFLIMEASTHAMS